jgi:glycogen(starch) synthase
VALEERRGVTVQRVREPGFTRDDLDAFIGWVARMNADMVAAAPADGCLELVHSHDWLVADAARALARRFEVPWLVTVHATEYGRHAGRVAEHPQAHIHAAERRMARDADRVIACSSYMRGHLREALGVRSERIVVIRNGWTRRT